MTTSENHDWLLPQNEQGDRGNLPGRHLRHFNSRSFFKQNSAQTFAKWIKPAVKLLFCLRRQHRRRTPSSFWSVKKHPESLRMVIWDRENFVEGNLQAGSCHLRQKNCSKYHSLRTSPTGTLPFGPQWASESSVYGHLRQRNFPWDQPERRGVVIWDRKIVPTSVVWGRRYCLLTQNFFLTIIAWGRKYCHLRQKTTH